MNTAFFGCLAVWSLYIVFVHVVGGGKRVLAPMLEATLPPFARATLIVVWHVTTMLLVLLAGMIAAAPFVTSPLPLLVLAIVLTVGFSVVFIRTARSELGAARSGSPSGCSSRRPRWRSSPRSRHTRLRTRGQVYCSASRSRISRGRSASRGS